MKIIKSRLPHKFWIRSGIFLIGLLTLLGVYLFQRLNPVIALGDLPPNVIFMINRTARLILNDAACFLIILAIFKEAKYLKIAFCVFLVELLIILPVYFAIKLSMEGDSEISSPLLSQVHRLIVNPMLMILLMAGFFYQRFRSK